MKVIIPAKRRSTRVPDKNWRPFYNNKSLTEVKIEQVLCAVSPEDVFLSCDDETQKVYADNYGINFLPRPAVLASDDTPWPDAVKGIVENTPFHEEEDIAWVEVINPLFSDFAGIFSKWQQVRDTNDSLVLTTPVTKFLLHKSGAPANFLPGKWHAMSQSLEPLYAWDSVCIMSKKNMLYFSYPIGKTPYLYTSPDAGMDIDTPDEFELAQLLYTRKTEKNANEAEGD
jgi:CMP-N-acetylneuraminic acid synthetase